jgi:NlpC/P60 family putative phage cell wall peptidase
MEMAIPEAEQRQAVIAEAESWIGTPFHHEAMVKGAGVDCGMLLAAVYRAAGVIPEFTVAHYAYQWHLHKSREQYLEYLERFGREIPAGEIGPGDVFILKMGRCYSHAGIITAWPHIIHAAVGLGVVADDAGANLRFQGRPLKFYSPWGRP